MALSPGPFFINTSAQSQWAYAQPEHVTIARDSYEQLLSAASRATADMQQIFKEHAASNVAHAAKVQEWTAAYVTATKLLDRVYRFTCGLPWKSIGAKEEKEWRALSSDVAALLRGGER